MSIIKNSVWNLFGYAIPTLIAIPSLGFLARGLGPEGFGIYTIAIALVGYAGIFDVGLTRSVIREIAIHRDNHHERTKVISTSTSFLVLFSCFGAFLLLIFSDGIVNYLKISGVEHSDIQLAFKLLAICIPLFILNQLWSAILEGDEKFGIVNIQKSISSSCIAGIPAIFVFYSATLSAAVAGLIFARVISILVSAYYVRNDIKISGVHFCYKTFKRLFFFGGWMTVSNIISPVMVYFDRFIVSNIMGADKVAFYSAPAEVILKLGIIPAAIGRAVFPRLSNIKDFKEFKRNVNKSLILMFLICLPVIIIGLLYSGLVLKIWFGENYKINSFNILNVLLIGFFFNALAMIPFSAIQALGKSKITALIHCAELVPYLALLYFMVEKYGLLGAAISWSIRVILDALLLQWLYTRMCSVYEN